MIEVNSTAPLLLSAFAFLVLKPNEQSAYYGTNDADDSGIRKKKARLAQLYHFCMKSARHFQWGFPVRAVAGLHEIPATLITRAPLDNSLFSIRYITA